MDPSAPLPPLVTRYITTVHLSKLTFSLGIVLFTKPQTQDRPCRASCPHPPWSSEQTFYATPHSPRQQPCLFLSAPNASGSMFPLQGHLPALRQSQVPGWALLLYLSPQTPAAAALSHRDALPSPCAEFPLCPPGFSQAWGRRGPQGHAPRGVWTPEPSTQPLLCLHTTLSP